MCGRGPFSDAGRQGAHLPSQEEGLVCRSSAVRDGARLSRGRCQPTLAQAGRQGVSGSGAAQTPRPEGTESHIHDFPQIILVIPARHRWHLHAHITVGNHRGLPSHLILFFPGMWLRFPFTCQRAGSVPLGAHTSPTMHQETEVCLELVSLDSRATPAPAAPGTPPPRGVAGGGLCPLHRVDRMFLECSTVSTPLPL